jgi:PAS domain S-box-containing protein
MPMTPSVDFQQLFEASANPYMLLDTKLRYVAANRAYLDVVGSRLEDLLGKTVLEAFPHDRENPNNANARMLHDSLIRVLETRERDVIAMIRYRVPRVPGGPPEDRCWSATHTPILDPKGNVVLILQHTVDITEIERLKATAGRAAPTEIAQMAADVLGRARVVQAANTTLGEELKRLLALFEQTPVLTCVLRGPDHVIEIANASCRKLVGDRALNGKTVRAAVPELEGQGFFERLDDVFRSGQPFVGKALSIVLEREAGTCREATIDVVFQPLLDRAGAIAGIFVQGIDITEQREAELERERLAEERGALLLAEQAARADAERANRLKDEFLATVSHELRTPLTAIIGWLQMMRNGQLTSERRANALETIDRNARALAQLVEDILDVSRIMSGKMNLEVEPVRVMDPTEAAIEAVQPAADAKGIRIHASFDPEAAVIGDAGRLQQIVWNLLSNAVKFTPSGGRVDAIVERRESSVAIVVADSGAGVAPEFLPHLFERFRQAEGGSTRRHGGLGLGLAIVKHLVELHGGTVSAESEGVGCGSRFVVLLPLALVHEDAAPERTAVLRAGFRAHVTKPIDVGELLAVIASMARSRR